MLRRFFMGFICISIFTFMMSVCCAANNNAEWYWISSDAKYSKFFAPDKVQVVKSFSGIASTINAWTKTTYSAAGAKETLDNYKLDAINPGNLAYSIAEVEIDPQNRTLAYIEETFFNKDGVMIWAKRYSPLRHKEINSQAFDEDFYCYIVDSVFGQGENERRKADDRWLMLWQVQNLDGTSVYSMADTTTMRLKGENIIFWLWQEEKAADGSVKKINFEKKAVNLPQGTEKVVRISQWDHNSGWKDITNTTDGMYHAITAGSKSEKALIKLRLYEGEHKAWIKRYSLDMDG